MMKSYAIICCFAALLLISSCSPEVSLCRKFISSKDSIKILLLKTDNLYKKNLKINADSLPESVRDSVSLANSTILGKIKDKTFAELVYNGMSDEIKKSKFSVYIEDSLNVFMKMTGKAYIFNLTQIELDEYFENDTAAQEIEDKVYYQDFVLNSASINLWFDVSQLNGDQDKKRMLFSSTSISDDVNGHFKRDFMSGEIKFFYKRKDITEDDVYQMAQDFGVTNADYIFDYFMNEYVYLKYKGKKKIAYMHYDPVRKMLSPAAYDRFIFM